MFGPSDEQRQRDVVTTTRCPCAAANRWALVKDSSEACYITDVSHDPARAKSTPMDNKRFIMNAGRTTKQGQQISAGKDHADYRTTVGTMNMHPDDMKACGILSGSTVRVRSQSGEATFKCVEGKIPQGMVFVPYGPPTCHLMGQMSDGTGMPTSKGWEVEIEPIDSEQPAEVVPSETGQPSRSSPRGPEPERQTASNLGFAETGPNSVSPWEAIEAGRYQPRRIRGSFRGRELG